MTRLATTSVVGSPLAHGWAKTISNSDQTLVCSLAVTSLNAKNVGHELVLLLEKAKVESTAQLHNLLLDLLAETRQREAQLQLALIWSPENSTAMAAATYQGQIILHRENRLGILLQSSTSLKLVEGKLKQNDQLVLLTQKAEPLKPTIEEALQKQVDTVDLTQFLEQQIKQLSDSSLISANLVNIQINKKTEKQAVGSNEQSPAQAKTTQSSLPQRPEPNEALSTAAVDATAKSSAPKNDNKEIKVKISAQSLLSLFKKIFNLFKQVFQRFSRLLKKIKKPSWLNSQKLTELTVVITRPKQLFNKLKPTQNIYLKKHGSKKIIRIFLISLILLLLLGISWWGYTQHIAAKQNQIRQELAPAETLLQQAQQQANQNIITARDQTASALELITAKQKAYEHDRVAQKVIEEYLTQANQFYEKISGIIEVSQLEIFFDINQVSPNFLTSVVSLDQNELYLFDQGQNILLSFNINSKQTNSLNLNEAQAVQDIIASEDKIYILNQGLLEIDLPLNPNSPPTQLKEEGDSDREAIMIEFFEGYLYVFNPEQRNIYRYVIREDGLSEPIGWLTNKQGLDFAAVTSFVVDGQIWLADKNGVIWKYEKGEPLNFEITGLEEPLGESIQLYANQNTEYLYVLEPAMERLLVLSKQGELIKQISSSTLASTTNFVVDEQTQRAFVISGSIIYTINLETAGN
jgi:hypothetical protein